MFAQEARERIKLPGWAVQREHARRGRSAERSLDAEPAVGLSEQGRVALPEAGPDLAVFVGPGPCGDVVEDDAGGLAGLRRPVGFLRGDQIGLAAQDHAVVEHPQTIGGERRARRGDVDDQLGAAGRRRTFGRACALDDAVIGDAVAWKKLRVRLTNLVATRIRM